jgi:hypothetical protein
MSMFSPNVTKADINALRSGPGGDKVPPGDYEVTPDGALRHIEPNEGWGGRGAYAAKFLITAANEGDEAGKKIETLFSYHPDPESSSKPAGYAKMNEITLQNMLRLLDATGLDPSEEADGSINLVEQLGVAFSQSPTLYVTVSHNDRGYQEVGNFRSAPPSA